MSLEELLLSNHVINNIYANINDLLNLIPELKDTINFEHKHPHHHLDVFNHSLLAMAMSPNDFTIRLVLLLHDIGKPYCYKEMNGVRHFTNHGEVSRRIAKQILLRLNFNPEYIEIVCEIISMHDEKITISDIEQNYDFYYLLYQIQYCDALAHHPLKVAKRINYLNETRELFIKREKKLIL